jgi:deoxyribodipyrimidine photo-lyase
MEDLSKIRIRALNNAVLNPAGDFVLYWMNAQRRTRWNLALEHAAAIARKLDKPLLVFEGLRAGYPHANRRHHSFIMDGMRANSLALKETAASYAPFIESRAGEGKGLIKALSEQACCVVTDDHPGFFYPRMLAKAATQCAVPLEAVDSCGLYPIYATERRFLRAYDFRRHLQKVLPEHLKLSLKESPIHQELPGLSLDAVAAFKHWELADRALSADSNEFLSSLPIDQSVQEANTTGGHAAGSAVLEEFAREGLKTYKEDRNHPDEDGTSGLSPYLHYGHLGAHQVFESIIKREDWSINRISPISNGAREGWWQMSPSAEAFLDQVITWRELGLQRSARKGAEETLSDAPAWALKTLDEHRDDERSYTYSLEEFESAQTHDELWNAAQQQLLQSGTIHNYLRMLWGKKILHWTESPEEAFKVMLHLNDKYALDGRDPNSFTGILWVLGLHDRPWGPERPIFGKIRYMASMNTRKKLHVKEYIKRWAPLERPLGSA